MAIEMIKIRNAGIEAIFVLSTLIGTPASAQGRQSAPSEIYNIYASAPQNTGKEVSITNAALESLRRCGIKAISDYSYAYNGMAPDFMVTITGPHLSVSAANVELQRAKRCGINGYIKRATLVGGE